MEDIAFLVDLEKASMNCSQYRDERQLVPGFWMSVLLMGMWLPKVYWEQPLMLRCARLSVPCALYMWYWLKCLSSIRQIIIVLPHSSAEGNETWQGHRPYLTHYNGDDRSLSMQYDTRILFLCHSKRTLDDLLDGPVSKGRKDKPALSTSPLHSLWNNLVVC